MSIAAILVRVGVEEGNQAAMFLDRHAPESIKLIGMRMSDKAAPRIFYAIALISIGWLGHDSWEFHHTFVLTDLATIAQPGDTINFRGRVEIVADNTWWFQRNTEPVGQAFPATFCKDFVPGLRRGHRVEVVVYSIPGVMSDCWTIASNPLGIIYK
jgi:hypothetical protein